MNTDRLIRMGLRMLFRHGLRLLNRGGSKSDPRVADAAKRLRTGKRLGRF